MIKDFINQFKSLDVIMLPNNTTVDISVFENIFREVEDVYSYESFMKIDGNEKGYKDFFDDLKEQGILN